MYVDILSEAFRYIHKMREWGEFAAKYIDIQYTLEHT